MALCPKCLQEVKIGMPDKRYKTIHYQCPVCKGIFTSKQIIIGGGNGSKSKDNKI